MFFDWDKAAQLIKERQPHCASAGLRGDWGWTRGEIYRNGKIVPKEETYTYLTSTWAVPELSLDGEIVSCYRMKNEVRDWGSSPYWPESARKILAAKENKRGLRRRRKSEAL